MPSLIGRAAPLTVAERALHPRVRGSRGDRLRRLGCRGDLHSAPPGEQAVGSAAPGREEGRQRYGGWQRAGGSGRRQRGLWWSSGGGGRCRDRRGPVRCGMVDHSEWHARAVGEVVGREVLKDGETTVKGTVKGRWWGTVKDTHEDTERLALGDGVGDGLRGTTQDNNGRTLSVRKSSSEAKMQARPTIPD